MRHLIDCIIAHPVVQNSTDYVSNFKKALKKKKKEAYYPLGGLAPNFRNHYYYNKPQKWIFKKLIYLISINVYYEY